jgi:adenylate cyclase class 2
MAQEIEIKLRISDTDALRRGLEKLGARLVGSGTGRVHEWNVLYDTPEGALAKNGQLLRIRTVTQESDSTRSESTPVQRVLLTFKRPPPEATTTSNAAPQPYQHKVREEFELGVTNPDILAKIFEGLGMTGWFRYEKHRTTFRLPSSTNWAKGLLIELDETPIGTFVELEGPPEAIDQAAQELGFSKSDYILKNYLTLYEEDCRRHGQEPRDMVYAVAK